MRFDLKSIYRGLANRYGRLAGEAGNRRGVHPGTVRSGRASSGNSKPLRSHSESAAARPGAQPARQDRAIEAARTERAHLARAFTCAHERNQIPMALALLQEGCGGTHLERAVAALPAQSTRPSLGARMAEIPRIEIGSALSNRDTAFSRQGVAARMKAAYDEALGRSQR